MKQLEFQSDNQAETRDVRHVFLVTPAACSVQRIIVMSPCPQPAQYVTLLCGDWRYLEIGTLMTHLLLILILIKRCSPAQQYTRAQYRPSEYNTCHLPKHRRQIINGDGRVHHSKYFGGSRKRHWIQFCLLCCQALSTARSPGVSVVRQHHAMCIPVPSRAVRRAVCYSVLSVWSMLPHNDTILTILTAAHVLPGAGGAGRGGCPGWCSSAHPSPAVTASCWLSFLHHYAAPHHFPFIAEQILLCRTQRPWVGFWGHGL